MYVKVDKIHICIYTYSSAFTLDSSPWYFLYLSCISRYENNKLFLGTAALSARTVGSPPTRSRLATAAPLRTWAGTRTTRNYTKTTNRNWRWFQFTICVSLPKINCPNETRSWKKNPLLEIVNDVIRYKNILIENIQHYFSGSPWL